MRKFRFYCPELKIGVNPLDQTESHHGIHVLRIQNGSSIEVFDGKGDFAEATICRITKKEIFIDVKKISQAPPKKTTCILGVSIAKGSRFDLVVEKCTELGIDQLCAVNFHRTVKTGKDQAMERYRRIAIAAAKQSGRCGLPVLTGPETVETVLSNLKQAFPKAICFYGGFEKDSITWDQFRTTLNDKQILIGMVGPEGGFCEEEINLFREHEFRQIRINPHMLRTETAAIALAALIGSLNS